MKHFFFFGGGAKKKTQFLSHRGYKGMIFREFRKHPERNILKSLYTVKLDVSSKSIHLISSRHIWIIFSRKFYMT